MPRPDCVGCGAVANEHRVHSGAEESLDEQRRSLIGADEIREWAEHCALAKLLALAEEARRRRRQTDALAFECVERIDLALHRRVVLIGAEELRTRCAFAIARGPVFSACSIELICRLRRSLSRGFDRNRG
jgi:hypothetical protein